MFNISAYLERIKKNLKSGEVSKAQILSTIKKHIELDIDPNLVEIKNYVLIINTGGAIKNKIFIHKSNILSELKNQSINIVDIR